MNRFTTIPVLALAIIAISGSAHAQMPRPSFGTDRAKLDFLVGTFTTETYIPPRSSTKKGETGKGTSSVTWGLDSMCLFIEDQNTTAMLGEYKDHGVLGYDAQNHQYVLAMFNNFGDRPAYKGNFVNDTLMLQTKVEMPGAAFDQKILWFKEGIAVKLRVLNDFGKGFVMALEQTSTPLSEPKK